MDIAGAAGQDSSQIKYCFLKTCTVFFGGGAGGEAPAPHIKEEVGGSCFLNCDVCYVP